jgi:hypothetical protein
MHVPLSYSEGNRVPQEPYLMPYFTRLCSLVLGGLYHRENHGVWHTGVLEFLQCRGARFERTRGRLGLGNDNVRAQPYLDHANHVAICKRTLRLGLLDRCRRLGRHLFLDFLSARAKRKRQSALTATC